MKKGTMAAIFAFISAFTIIVIGGIILFAGKKEKNLEQEPYFTSAKLSEHDMEYLVNRYHFTCSPEWSSNYDKRNWPDYSFYELSADPLTEKSAGVLNYMLFTERSEKDGEAISLAEEEGFSKDKPLTVDWVLNNPGKAVAIMDGLLDHGDFFCRSEK